MPPFRVPAVLVLLLAVLSAALAADNNATARAGSAFGFLDCLSAVRGRSSRAALLNADEEQRDVFLGKVMGCAKAPVLRGLRAVRDGKDVHLWDGAVVLHRVEGAPDVAPGRQAHRDEEASRAMGQDGGDDDNLGAYHDMIVELDRVSRSYAMDVEVYPGVKASLNRDARNDEAVNLSFKLDRRGLWDEEEEEVQDEEGQGRGVADDYVEGLGGEEEEQEEAEQQHDEQPQGEDRHGHKKKKVLKGLKKLKKKLAPYLPLLAIPLAIQLMMLPLYIMALKMMALKSILLGKMTLMLVAFNILRNVQQRQIEDDHNSRVAAEYYGYQDDGIEYGGWVNRRRGFSGRSETPWQQRSQGSSRRRRR